MRKILSVVALLIGLMASSFAFAAKVADEMKIVGEGSVRSTPTGQHVTAAFFGVENKSDTPHYLTAVKSTLSKNMVLHRTVQEGKDMMSMKPVAKLEIPAHGKLTLQPGGNHVMMMDLEKPVTVGERVTLMLVFEDGSELPAKLLVTDVRD